MLAARGLPEIQAHMWDVAEQRIFAIGTLSATGMVLRELVAEDAGAR